MLVEDIETLTDEQISEYQEAFMAEMNRRLRITAIPAQIRDIITDARRGGELSDAAIRGAFEAAMTEEVATDAA